MVLGVLPPLPPSDHCGGVRGRVRGGLRGTLHGRVRGGTKTRQSCRRWPPGCVLGRVRGTVRGCSKTLQTMKSLKSHSNLHGFDDL